MPSHWRSRTASDFQFIIENFDLAGIRGSKPFADFDRGRLAGAVGAEETEALASANLEVERVDRDDVRVDLA